MDRTLGADWTDIGGGKRGFRSQNAAAGVPGSEVTGEWLTSLQEEIMSVIESEAIVPDKDTWSQLLQAITAKLVLLQLFPETLSADGKLIVTSPANGTIRIAADQQFVLRGAKKIKTVQTDLATAPSKIYHLRWRKTDGNFVLYDLSSGAYNPGAFTENNRFFDSIYDDMLVAKISTDGANVPTIVTLVNKAQLVDEAMIDGTSVQLSAANGANYLVARTLNWARTPTGYTLEFVKIIVAGSTTDADVNIIAAGPSRTDPVALTGAAPSIPFDRYGMNAVVMRDFSTAITMHFSARA